MNEKIFIIMLGEKKEDCLAISNIDNYFWNKVLIAPKKFKEFWKGFSEEQQTKIKENILSILKNEVSTKSKNKTGKNYNCEDWDALMESLIKFRKKTKQTEELKESRTYLNMVSLSKWFEIESYLTGIEEKIKKVMSEIEV